MAVEQVKERQINEFLDFVGGEVDCERARAILESAGWNTQAALNMFCEGIKPEDFAPMEEDPPIQAQGANPRQQDHRQDLSRMSVEELRGLLASLEVDHSWCREKAELMDLLTAAMVGGGAAKSPSHSRSPRRRPPHRTGPSTAATGEQARANAERRQEIADQNAELAESLRIDQQREQLRKEAEEEERQKKQREAEEEEAKAKAAHEEHLKLEAKRARVSQPEANREHPDRCQIVVRTPSGQRLSRTFLGSDNASLLYDWVDVVCNEEAFTKSRYMLVSRLPGQPAKELHNSPSTLKDLGVEHQTMFFVTVLD
jgi:hypothetical protein